MDGEFVTVGRKGRKGKKTGTADIEKLARAQFAEGSSGFHAVDPKARKGPRGASSLEERTALLDNHISEKVAPLRASRYCEGVVGLLRNKGVFDNFKDIVCYGIGPLATSRVAQYQAALLLVLKEEGAFERVHIYDPTFCDVDLAWCEVVGLEVIEKNEECRRHVERPTLFYMPHCGHRMVSNVLGANWTNNGLSNVALVSNRFSSVTLRLGPADKGYATSCVVAAEAEFDEFELEDCFENMGCFNDLALHILKKGSNKDWGEAPDANLDRAAFDPELVQQSVKS